MTRRNLVVLSLVIAAALGGLIAGQASAAGDLSPGEARKIIARMAGIQLPSDAVRVKDISSAGNSAVVIAQVETAFRFAKGDKGKWRVTEIRTGDRRWEDVDTLVRALNAEKTARARAELESIAVALESFRREHGFYVDAKTEASLVDHLNPRYLSRIIRVDPWHAPYVYEGGGSAFTLRSAGPDGKPNTDDDILMTGHP